MSEQIPRTSFDYALAAPGAGESWNDKALREVQLLETGLGGMVNAAKTSLDRDHLADTGAKLAFAVGTGFALSHMAANPGLAGLVGRSVGTALGASFLVDVAGNGSKVVGAMADTWQSGENFDDASKVMRSSLGQFGFDALLMSAGGIAGGKLAGATSGSLFKGGLDLADGLRPSTELASLKLDNASLESTALKNAAMPGAREASPIPRFNHDGFLDPGDYKVSWQQFVDRFGYNSQRRDILASFQEMAGTVKNAGGAEVRVGGSFVTSKVKPKDIDAAWSRTGVDEESLHPDVAARRTQGMSNTINMKGDFFPNDYDPPDLGVWGDALAKNRAGDAVGTVTVDLSTMPARPPAADVLESWRQTNRERSIAQQKASQAQALDLAARQGQVEALQAELPQAIAGKDEATVQWLGKFGRVNEGTSFDTRAVAEDLIKGGYKVRDRVGDPLVKTDKQAFAQWFVGQCLVFLQRGETIPSTLSMYAEQYAGI